MICKVIQRGSLLTHWITAAAMRSAQRQRELVISATAIEWRWLAVRAFTTEWRRPTRIIFPLRIHRTGVGAFVKRAPFAGFIFREIPVEPGHFFPIFRELATHIFLLSRRTVAQVHQNLFTSRTPFGPQLLPIRTFLVPQIRHFPRNFGPFGRRRHRRFRTFRRRCGINNSRSHHHRQYENCLFHTQPNAKSVPILRPIS